MGENRGRHPDECQLRFPALNWSAKQHALEFLPGHSKKFLPFPSFYLTDIFLISFFWIRVRI
ncbi:MAG: hypothetical protein JWQ35_31 [Bacteriovoracaceae bacterium]|nr:hypothetical protein [Bacteriovoracaceae bacterium]